MAGEPAGGGESVGSKGSRREPQAGRVTGTVVVVVVVLVVDLVRVTWREPAGAAAPVEFPHPAARAPTATRQHRASPTRLGAGMACSEWR